MIPTRETFGNIPHASQVVFYWLTALALAVFAWGLWRRYRLWRMGTPANTWQTAGANLRRLWEQARPRLKRLLIEALGQKRVRGRGLPSGAHLGLFAGFMMLFLGTTLLEIDHLASGLSESLKFHQGAYYVIYEFTLDLFGLLFLAGCVLFGWCRLRRPASVGHKATDWYVLVSFVAIGLTGYVVEGLRMAWQQPTGLWGALFTGRIMAGARFLRLEPRQRSVGSPNRLVGSCAAGFWFHRFHSIHAAAAYHCRTVEYFLLPGRNSAH